MDSRTDLPDDLEGAILDLKRERRALLLAHYYQESEVQDLADVVGDSLALARQASNARMVLVDDAGHTFQARHPFESSPPELDEAVQRTIRHFERHLISQDS